MANPLKFVWEKLIKPFGPLIGIAVGRAISFGLSDELLKVALDYVKALAKKEINNDERRQQGVQFLVDKGLPESVARLAIELAYQAYKKELEPKL